MPFDFFDAGLLVERGLEDTPKRSSRQRRGASAFEAGRSAERIVQRYYEHAGYALKAERWRGEGGEIDLIFLKDGVHIFVEVKRARCVASAAQRIKPAQMQRIAQAAEEYAGHLPNGLLSDMRIDVALVDGIGAVTQIENAFGG